MPRLLIAGCGYLGQAVADLFVDENWEVEGWTMSPESAQQLSSILYSVLAVDISQEKKLRAQKGDFDTVVDCAILHGGDGVFLLYLSVKDLGTHSVCFSV